MNTIIVPIDGSASERALPVAEMMAARFDAGLVLVHVQARIVGGRGGLIPARLDEAQRLVHVRELVARLEADGFDVELETHRTTLEHPASIIAAAAARHDADAIGSPRAGMPRSSACWRQASRNDCCTPPLARCSW
jgi:nucleotide-binding universal stress UspA family protein